MSDNLNAGHWRLDPFKRIQVWVWEPGHEPVKDAFDEPFVPLPPEPPKPKPPPKKTGPKLRPIEHGTRSGYQMEIRRDLTPCAPCLEAARLYRKAQRRKTNLNQKDAA